MTPEQEDQVARALAETARHEPVPPLPDDVASRLDDVLADLVTARTADETSGAGVDVLAAHRRRRRPNLLVAAAAVALVVAAGGAVVRGDLGTTPGDGGSAGSTARDAPEAAEDRAAAQEGPSSSTARAATPRLRTSTLAQDVRRALADDLSDAQGPGPRRKALTGPPQAADGCAAPSAGPGERLLAVRLDGRPATLLLGPVRADTRSAEVYSCGDPGSPVARATVRLR